jgi:WD40 repeat protein
VGQIAEALQYAHEQGIVHGRLKPENCLLVDANTVCVCDWYQAFLPGELRVILSPYIAPEQLHGQTEPASDQYTLAIMAYQLLGGQLPFSQLSGKESMPLRSQYSPRSLTELRPGLPRQLDSIVRRALSKNVRERFPNIITFAHAFRVALESLTSSSGPQKIPHQLTLMPAFRSDPPLVAPIERPQTHPNRILPLCLLPGHTSAIPFLHWAPDGIHLASASSDEHIRIWRIRQRIGIPLATLTGHSGRISGLCWSPDSRFIASAGSDATVRIWNVSMLPTVAPTVEKTWWGHDGSVTALAWSPDGAFIASGGVDRTLRLWGRKGEALAAWQAHGRGGITALSWAPNSYVLASGGADRMIHIWDASTKMCLATCKGQGDAIHHLSWSPDGTLLASSAGKNDSRVCIWNPRKGEIKTPFTGHSGEVAGIGWSSDASWIATASSDCNLRFWSMQGVHAERVSQSFVLEHPPVSMTGPTASGLIALGRPDMLISVLQLATS